MSFSTDIKHIKNINILTWWGYLNYPEIITAAENNCHVKISFDEYFSNDEFLRRWEEQKDSYDVIIFSDTIYSIVKDKIPVFEHSTLWQQTNFYHPVIKAHYEKKGYPHNTVYFIHALTGFLWNPKNISLSPTDSITTIFKKAKKNYVVIIDDPVEAKKLIEAGLSEYPSQQQKNTNSLSISNFKALTEDATVYITNNYSQIYKKDKFAFSFSWSGAAVVDLMASNENYKFFIHPHLSYISSDLIAQTSERYGSLCVAKFLSTHKIIAKLQEDNYYFSPYKDKPDIVNPIYQDMYKKFLLELPSLAWINSSNPKDFQKTNQSWQLIKLSLTNHMNNHE